jgi:hypothetical protein
VSGEHWGKAKNTSLCWGIGPLLDGLAQLRRNRDLVKCGIGAGHGHGGDNGSVAWLKIIFCSSFVVQHKGSDGLRNNLRLRVFDTGSTICRPAQEERFRYRPLYRHRFGPAR